MKMSTVDILRGEFIGKHVKIIGMDIEGTVLDETKNSFLVKMQGNERKRLLKGNCTFEFGFPEGKVAIKGRSILMKPEDRIKIKR
jgi:RNase P/RNase MRP subunit p29